MTSVLIKNGNADTDTHREQMQVKVQAEFYTPRTPRMSGNLQKPGEGCSRFSSGANPADTVTPDACLRGPRQYISVA